MLQFWKKDKPKSPNSSPIKLPNGNIKGSFDSDHVAVGPLSNFNLDLYNKQPCEPKSRLTLDIEDVLTNRIVLFYFGQFIEARGFTNWLSLWLELERVPNELKAVALKRHLPPGSPSKPSVLATGQSSEPSKPITSERIFTEYLAEEASCKVRVTDEIKSDVQVGELNCLSRLKNFAFQTLKRECWNDFLRSDWHCKYQVEVMTSGTMTLSDVLYSDSCLGSFIEFLEQEGQICVIEFWLAATSFEKQFTVSECTDPNQIQNDAIAIYEKYLSLQATSPLGVSDKVRLSVEEGICSGGAGDVTSPSCFSRAVVAVEGYMKSVLLRPFLSSSHYLTLLSDVMGSSRSNHHSPASSVITDSGPLSQIETTPVPPSTDPDSLWWRKRQASGLTLGKVDRLGRYEPDFEPEPEKRPGSSITRFVKLLVNKDEQKSQEEMAWRVAEMIVKDITSITLGDNQDLDGEDF